MPPATLPSPARQYFGVGTKPVEEYFAPVVPSMAGRRPVPAAQEYLLQLQRDTYANDALQQQELLVKQDFDRQQAARTRGLTQRLQTTLDPELEQQTILEQRNKFGQTQEASQAQIQKQRFFDAAHTIDFQSEAAADTVGQLAAENPLAMSDPDVANYLRIRGYQPSDKLTEQKGLREYRESLTPDIQPAAAGATTLPQAKSAAEWKKQQDAIDTQLASRGITKPERDKLRKADGTFDIQAANEAIYQRSLVPTPEKAQRSKEDVRKHLGYLIDKRDKAVGEEAIAAFDALIADAEQDLLAYTQRGVARKQPPPSPATEQKGIRQFKTPEEAMKAGLKPGERVIVGGRPATWR